VRSRFIQRQSKRRTRLQIDVKKAQRRRRADIEIRQRELRRRESPSGFDVVHATNKIFAGEEEEKADADEEHEVIVFLLLFSIEEMSSNIRRAVERLTNPYYTI
jgi:hypothetical protein